MVDVPKNLRSSQDRPLTVATCHTTKTPKPVQKMPHTTYLFRTQKGRLMGAFPLWNFKPATREKHQQYIYMTRLWIAYPLVYLSIYIYILKYKYIYTDLNLPHLKLFAAIYIYIYIYIQVDPLPITCQGHAFDVEACQFRIFGAFPPRGTTTGQLYASNGIASVSTCVCTNLKGSILKKHKHIPSVTCTSSRNHIFG